MATERSSIRDTPSISPSLLCEESVSLRRAGVGLSVRNLGADVTTPSVQQSAKFSSSVRIIIRQIVFLADICGEVIEFALARIEKLDELPITFSYCSARAAAEEMWFGQGIVPIEFVALQPGLRVL